MVSAAGKSMEKVTFNMSTELKMQVMALKKELKVSLSSIYNEAITNYLKEKEADKWRQGVSLALQDRKYQEWSAELGSDNGDFYDY
jgi:post-segregation antitoxin (ccd killing protein)